MSLIVCLIWAAIVAFGPVALDFWTEVGVTILGIYVLSALGAAAES